MPAAWFDNKVSRPPCKQIRNTELPNWLRCVPSYLKHVFMSKGMFGCLITSSPPLRFQELLNFAIDLFHRVQGVARGSRFQRTEESFFYASATDWMWVTFFFIIFSINLQKIYCARKTATVKLCFDH